MKKAGGGAAIRRSSAQTKARKSSTTQMTRGAKVDISTDLTARAARLAERAMARLAAGDGAAAGAGAPTTAPQQPPALPAVKLPQWPDTARGLPNVMLRSALFGAVRKGRRRYCKAEQIAAIDGIEIIYTGESLDQGDFDVWQSVLHAVRAQKLGVACRVTSYSLLKLMGKTDSGKNRATLHERITRLRANAVEVRQGRYCYIGGLLASAAKDDQTQEWVIAIDPMIRPLFASDQFTQVDWAVRHALDGQPLAQWLHSFYASHAKPFPLKIETLHRLCGSQATLMSDFAKTLRKALDAVTEASKAHSAGFRYDLRGDLVHVEKPRKPRDTVPATPRYRSSNPAIPFQQPRDTVPATPLSTGQTGRKASNGAGLLVSAKPS